MKAEDIIKALVARLPALTDKFSDTVAITTITSTGLVATATVSGGHNVVDNELVTIVDALSPISIVSITRVDDRATVVTTTNHDSTLSDKDIARGFEQDVILSGSTEAEFNGTFNLASVTNRREFVIDITDSGPTIATGTPILENGSSPLQGYNGSFNVTVLNSTQFTYPLQAAIPNDAIGSPILHKGHRITGSVTIERFLDAYTKKQASELYAVVVLGDVIASKGRENRSDSTDRFEDNQHYQQEITQPFGIYIIFPASNSIAARTQRDEAEDIIPFIMQSVLLESFPTGFAVGRQMRATFNAHGFFSYNGPLYVHEVTFEQNADLLFLDSIGVNLSVAFRDIELTMNTDLGDTTLTANIDLDSEPLP